MDNKFFIETKNFKKNDYNKLSQVSPIQFTNDNLVNDFLNRNVSLESLIEKEIYNTKL